jgi:hypothetical protein
MKVMDLVIRKNIIILLMLLTVAGGAFDTFLRDKSKPQEITENPLVAFVTDITEFIVKDISEKDRYTIKRITEGWQQDPLISIKDQPKQEPKKKIVIPDPNVSYTGFMRLGDGGGPKNLDNVLSSKSA